MPLPNGLVAYVAGRKSAESSGEGGTTNYAALSNKPQINGVTLSGNKTAEALGLVAKEAGKGLSAEDYTTAEKAAVATIADKVDKVSGKGLSTEDYTTAEKAAVATIGDKVDKEAGKGLSTNDFTDAAALSLETASEKSNAAFSALDGLLTGLQVPAYKRFISKGAFRLTSTSGGKLDDFHVSAGMAGQTVYAVLYTDFTLHKNAGGKNVIVSGNHDVKTAVVGEDGGINVTFDRVPCDFFIVVTTTDMAAHYANENHGEVTFAKVLFTCRYTRNTGVFMGLDDIPAVSMADFADKLGYSLWYEPITDMTPEAVATTTSDAIFLYSGAEYYELAATKPSEIPNQNVVYYRCKYQRKEL